MAPKLLSLPGMKWTILLLFLGAMAMLPMSGCIPTETGPLDSVPGDTSKTVPKDTSKTVTQDTAKPKDTKPPAHALAVGSRLGYVWKHLDKFDKDTVTEDSLQIEILIEAMEPVLEFSVGTKVSYTATYRGHRITRPKYYEAPRPPDTTLLEGRTNCQAHLWDTTTWYRYSQDTTAPQAGPFPSGAFWSSILGPFKIPLQSQADSMTYAERAYPLYADPNPYSLEKKIWVQETAILYRLDFSQGSTHVPTRTIWNLTLQTIDGLPVQGP